MHRLIGSDISISTSFIMVLGMMPTYLLKFASPVKFCMNVLSHIKVSLGTVSGTRTLRV